MQAVVALIRIEAGLADQAADLRPLVQPEPRHALFVRHHVGLADDSSAHTDRAEIVPKGQLADRQRHPVPGGAVAKDGSPGIERRARRAADGRLHISPIEADPAGGQPVDVRRFQMGMPVAAEVIPTQLVGHDEQDVFDGRHDVTSSGWAAALL